MAEHQPLLTNTTLRQRCPVSYHFQFIRSKGALLVLLWDLLSNIYRQFIKCVFLMVANDLLLLFLSHSWTKSQVFIYTFEYSTIVLVSPLMGFIADVFTGRYRLIVVCCYILVFLLALLLCTYIAISYQYLILALVVLCASYGAVLFIIAGIQANIIPFNIDQLVGSSSDELSAIIHWHATGPYLAGIAYSLIVSTMKNQQINEQIVYLAISGISIIIILLSHSFFKHWLDATPQITNPITKIARVLNYARKNKYPRNRSALTYWEEESPSRLDLGKEKYGGPFIEEEVEDVKTILRLLPLFICALAFGVLTWDFRGIMSHSRDYHYVFSINIPNVVPLFLILLYQFLIYPCFSKYIPSMLKRIGFGLLLAFISNLSFVLISLIGHFTIHSPECIVANVVFRPTRVMPINYLWTIVPQVLDSCAIYLTTTIGLEFVVAQSPKDMRGLMVALFLSARGLGSLIGLNLPIPYHYLHSAPLGCGFYYFLTRTLVTFFIFIIFIFLANRYKLRVRENEINVHIIAEDHIIRYIDQEDEYRQELGLSSDSTVTYGTNTINS